MVAHEGVGAPRTHCVRAMATIAGPAPGHHPTTHPPKQPTEPQKSSVAGTIPVSLGFVSRVPIRPGGFWAVVVHSWRPLDGCSYHREGAQVSPKIAPPRPRRQEHPHRPSRPRERNWAQRELGAVTQRLERHSGSGWDGRGPQSRRGGGGAASPLQASHCGRGLCAPVCTVLVPGAYGLAPSSRPCPPGTAPDTRTLSPRHRPGHGHTPPPPALPWTRTH